MVAQRGVGGKREELAGGTIHHVSQGNQRSESMKRLEGDAEMKQVERLRSFARSALRMTRLQCAGSKTP